jgi:hypothetical protein
MWYVGITQPLIMLGVLRGLLLYGAGHYWLIVSLALLNFYCTVPAAWLALRTTLTNRSTARRRATAVVLGAAAASRDARALEGNAA